MSHPVVPAFQITGPVNTAYPGTFCLPQVPLVPNVTFNIGDNITIQVIETAQHGAAIYNVSNFRFVSENETDRHAIVRRCDARGSNRRARSECVQLLQLFRLELPIDLCDWQPQQRRTTDGNCILFNISYAASTRGLPYIHDVVRRKGGPRRTYFVCDKALSGNTHTTFDQCSARSFPASWQHKTFLSYLYQRAICQYIQFKDDRNLEHPNWFRAVHLRESRFVCDSGWDIGCVVKQKPPFAVEKV